MYPMRLVMAFWWSLALFWLVARELPAEQSVENPPSAQADKGWPREEAGFGQNYDEARKEAARFLAKKAAEHLRAQTPPITAWQPTPEYVEQNLFEPNSKQGPDFEYEKIVRKTWIFTVKPLDLAAIRLLDQQAARQQRSEHRTLLFAYVTGGLAVVLSVFFAYLRLDDWTNGRYRRLLQMGVAALLVAAGTGWWLWVTG
ncbi:MAG: hypothetical protein L0Y72_18180 [Gemmataceae bacterium]|nr:hypothetical protein [Gemmataceae bacterium]MCI0740979.1 hypothetical protein [Gemmataceae bacterium]